MLVVAGIGLLGAALWWWFGPPALLAMLGTLLVIVGVALAMREGQAKGRR